MKDPDNLQEVAGLQPDYLGFIFYPKSKRYMVDTLSPEMLRSLPASIRKVGVFVNAATEDVLEQAAAYGLDVLQLHGNESPEQCDALQGHGYTIIKAFGVNEEFDFNSLKPYAPVVDYYLFDTKGPGYGGHGIPFDWSVLQKYDKHKAFFLSGGLGLEEVGGVKSLKEFPLYAIDVNSRFEAEPGLKNISLLKQLQKQLAQSQEN